MNAHERFLNFCKAAGGFEDQVASDYANSCFERADEDVFLPLFDTHAGHIDDDSFLKMYCDHHRAKFGVEFEA